MARKRAARAVAMLGIGLLMGLPAAAEEPLVRTGAAAFGDFTQDTPGVRRRITVGDMPKPFATRSASNGPSVVAAPAGALPKLPPGFTAERMLDRLDNPRAMRVAPNGDVFLADSAANRVLVLRLAPSGPPIRTEVFAKGLYGPFGIAFYPSGPRPQWIYVANTNSVVRFPYQDGDLRARGAAQTVVASLPDGGHATRDIGFSPDDRRMYVSVGSASNVGQRMGRKSAAEAAAWDGQQGIAGAGWGEEANRAAVLAFTPDGKSQRVFATGIRNCVGLAVQPAKGDVWCSTNERDGLGDDLVPDYITRVKEGGFYGWPWYYMGNHEDPRLKGERPDLNGKVTVPDVLLQPHSASLQLAFYTGTQFPKQYQGDIFAAEHGSWNRTKRTGYKVIRVVLKDGVPTGEYEDFMTGFVLNSSTVWGRPVGVAVAADGSLLVSEDGNGTIWRVRYSGPGTQR